MFTSSWRKHAVKEMLRKLKEVFMVLKPNLEKLRKCWQGWLKQVLEMILIFLICKMGSVILECIPWPGCQAAYRIYSNKRRSAYLIFRATSAALILWVALI